MGYNILIKSILRKDKVSKTRLLKKEVSILPYKKRTAQNALY
jgi:hypothetical protein